MADTITLYLAAAVRDAVGVNARPGAVAVRAGRIVAAGRPEEVAKAVRDLGPVERVELPDSLILPAMVNAHAHLDLTHIGPIPYGGDFVGWIEMVMRRRPREEAEIAAAVRHGLRLSREAGVGLLGDIAGSDAAVRARIDAADAEWIDGTSWLECFGFGKQAEVMAEEVSAKVSALWREKVSALWREKERGRPPPASPRNLCALLTRLIRLRRRNRSQPAQPGRNLAVEIQPHAPYSAGLPLYEAAEDYCIGRPSTHLAETPEELEFVAHATGPLADLLKRLGKWDDSIRPTGQTPFQYLREHLKAAWWTLAHCNYATDDDIAILAGLSEQVAVAYCPSVSEYFGHPRSGNHRYRDMLAAGINVCLGTDSILCQSPDEPQPLGVLPQMRRLYRRDRTDPQTLLEMATVNGRKALLSFFRHEVMATLQPTAPARMLAVRIDPHDATDPLVQALLNTHPARPIGDWSG